LWWAAPAIHDHVVARATKPARLAADRYHRHRPDCAHGNNLAEFRAALLAGRSGVSKYEIRYVGQTLAGVCIFEAQRYQSKKDIRRGTRAGSVGIYCANEAVKDAGVDWAGIDKNGVGISSVSRNMAMSKPRTRFTPLRAMTTTPAFGRTITTRVRWQ